ncbi:class I SAM-dependent methyltransferase [Actinocrispum sp. NPDC049592]|uniref:class I SAM-dependent methyltransferase n=1 Tax=Actinocrispum sp. NPDC049592 TaxID=3154835 RepID=UPI00343C7AC2
MTGLSERLLDMGFGHPRGPLGRLGGRLMARGNAATEQRLVDFAALTPDESVLIIGPGPGIGVRAAATRARHTVAVDPSETMLSACRKRCADLIADGKVALIQGDAANTTQPDDSADVILSVNNVMLWPDWHAGFTELRRVLRPGGRILLSAHDKWLPGGLPALKAAVTHAGFIDTQTWTWEPPTRGATTAAQLRAHLPATG